MEGDGGEKKKEGQTGFSRGQKNIPSGGSSQVTMSYGRNGDREIVENRIVNRIGIMYTTNRRLIEKREPEISWEERRLTTEPGRRHHAAMKKGCGRELTIKEKVMTQREIREREIQSVSKTRVQRWRRTHTGDLRQ